MGAYQHRALIVVFSDYNEHIGLDIYRKAVALTGPRTTPIVEGINGYRMFSVLPLGSKVGWQPANEHEAALDSLYADAKKDDIEATLVSFGEFGHWAKYTREEEDTDES